jgi:hypothetical protein
VNVQAAGKTLTVEMPSKPYSRIELENAIHGQEGCAFFSQQLFVLKDSGNEVLNGEWLEAEEVSVEPYEAYGGISTFPPQSEYLEKLPGQADLERFERQEKAWRERSADVCTDIASSGKYDTKFLEHLEALQERYKTRLCIYSLVLVNNSITNILVSKTKNASSGNCNASRLK